MLWRHHLNAIQTILIIILLTSPSVRLCLCQPLCPALCMCGESIEQIKKDQEMLSSSTLVRPTPVGAAAALNLFNLRHEIYLEIGVCVRIQKGARQYGMK